MKILSRIRSVTSLGGIKAVVYLGIAYAGAYKLPDNVDSLPRSIQIEPTSRCNLRCSMCYINELERGEGGDMSFESFKKMINESFPYWHTLRLWGIGEPLLNKDLFKMIKYERRLGNYVATSTNALLLDRKSCKSMVESGLNRLNISIDAASKKSYEKIRHGGDFDVLLENLDVLSDVITKRRSKLKLSITFVAMKENLGELPRIIDLACRFKIPNIGVQSVQTSKTGQTIDVKQSIAIDEGALKFLNDMAKVGEQKGINVSIPNLGVSAKRTNCVWPWLQAYVTWDGFLTPCCRNISERHYVCGNLTETSLKVLWNNERYKNFRRNLRGDNLPQICRGCTNL